MQSEEVNALKSSGYDPMGIYNSDERVRNVLDNMRAGFGDGESYEDICNRLIIGGNGSPADEFMLLADFDSYVNAQKRMAETYLDRARWNDMSIHNIARSGLFAADRAIAQYADNIWHVEHKSI